MKRLILLTAVWLILNGTMSLPSIAWGFAISAASLWLAIRFMKPSKISGVSVLKLIFYPFFLLGQVYYYGFAVIKMIIFGCKTEVVTINTAITNDFLQVMLCNSITMIPGSVVLDRTENNIQVIVLRNKNAVPYAHYNIADITKEVLGKTETNLIKAQL